MFVWLCACVGVQCGCKGSSWGSSGGLFVEALENFMMTMDFGVDSQQEPYGFGVVRESVVTGCELRRIGDPG